MSSQRPSAARKTRRTDQFPAGQTPNPAEHQTLAGLFIRERTMTDSIETSEDEALPWVPPVDADDVHAITYKLPPLPKNLPNVVRRIRACEGDVAAQVVFEHALNEYAIAAIEAQGVPDVDDLIAGALYDFLGHLTSMEKSISFGANEWVTPAVDALIQFAEKRRLTLNNPAIESWTESLASAPQAPQEPIDDNSHSDLEYSPEGPGVDGFTPQASVVQQEPANVRWRWNIELDGDDLLVCFNDHDKGESCSYQRYVPAPQAKPQPLTNDQKWDMWTAATIEQPSARGCYFRGVEDAEAAHGIQGSAA